MLPEPGTHTGGCGSWIGRGHRFTVASWKYRPFHEKISRACHAFSVSAKASRYRSAARWTSTSATASRPWSIASDTARLHGRDAVAEVDVHRATERQAGHQ